MEMGTHVGSRSWQKETRLRNMFWSVRCSGIGLHDGGDRAPTTTTTGSQVRWGGGIRVSLIQGNTVSFVRVFGSEELGARLCALLLFSPENMMNSMTRRVLSLRTETERNTSRKQRGTAKLKAARSSQEPPKLNGILTFPPLLEYRRCTAGRAS